MAVGTASSWAALVKVTSEADRQKRTTLAQALEAEDRKRRNPIHSSQIDKLMAPNQSMVNAREGDFSALGLTTKDLVSNLDLARAYQVYWADTRRVAPDIPSTAPQPSESRGQLRVDLDTSPVQTKDSVMYRNAGEGEESTIGEASRPNKRKPGLSSNLGINL